MGVQLAGGPVGTLTTFTGEVSHLWNPQTTTVVTSQIIITNLALVKKFEVSPRSYQDMTQRQEVSKCCWKKCSQQTRLMQVAHRTDLQCIKNEISVKESKVKYNKMRSTHMVAWIEFTM